MVLVRPQKWRVDVTYKNCLTALRMSEQYNKLCLSLNIKLRVYVFLAT